MKTKIKAKEIYDYIDKGHIKDGTKLNVYYDDNYTTQIKYDGFNFIWETGTFTSGMFFHPLTEFEIIEESKKIENIKLDSEECIEYYEDGIKKHLNTNKKDKMYVKVLNEIIDYINRGNNDEQ